MHYRCLDNSHQKVPKEKKKEENLIYLMYLMPLLHKFFWPEFCKIKKNVSKDFPVAGEVSRPSKCSECVLFKKEKLHTFHTEAGNKFWMLQAFQFSNRELEEDSEGWRVRTLWYFYQRETWSLGTGAELRWPQFCLHHGNNELGMNLFLDIHNQGY